jgi:hypothetical protein
VAVEIVERKVMSLQQATDRVEVVAPRRPDLNVGSRIHPHIIL